MRKNTVTPQSKNKSKSTTRTASPGLVEFLSQKYPKAIPIPALTAAYKLYGRGKALTKEDRIIRRFTEDGSTINTSRFLEYLGQSETQQKGKGLSEDAVKRVYQNFSNSEGKLSFEFLMKMGESSGVVITEKLAKAIVRKYGRRKDHLDIEDCLRINQRRDRKNSSSKSPKRK